MEFIWKNRLRHAPFTGSSPNWIDDKIAEAFGCSRRTVEQVRERLVTNGFELTLDGKRPTTSPTAKRLSGEQEAVLIAMRLGSPPAGYGSWTLKLLKNQLIELEIVDTISHETVRKNGLDRRCDQKCWAKAQPTCSV